MKKFILAALLVVLIPVSSMAAGLVDLNSASIEQIQELPGVGKKTAEAIVAARPFKSVEDLKNVKGIGDAKFAKLKDVVSVSGTAAPAAAAAPVAAAPSRPSLPAAAPAASSVASAAAKAKAGALKAGELVNINTASIEELDRLPGIGAVKAKAIVSARPFASIEDLTKVRGIKEATLAKLKPFITVK